MKKEDAETISKILVEIGDMIDSAVRQLDTKIMGLTDAVLRNTSHQAAMLQAMIDKKIISEDEFLKYVESANLLTAKACRDEIDRISKDNPESAKIISEHAEKILAEFTQTSSAPE